MLDDIPERIGPYRIDALIGVGGMGEVYKGWDQERRRPVALKRLALEAVADPKLRKRFRREAEAASRLDHPTIVKVFDVLESDSGDWIVMELVDGTTLARLVEKKRPPDLLWLVRIARQVAEGLDEARAKNIIHRDLKAENILVDERDQVHILDFGLAKHEQKESDTTSLTIRGAMVGTCRAMSPEQAVSDHIDHRSDLFSLGSMLYELIVGESPFAAATPLQTVARVVGFKQPPLRQKASWVPTDLAHLVDKLLEKEPDDRPANAREVAIALNVIEARLGRRGGRRPWPWVAAAAVAIALLGGVYLHRPGLAKDPGELRTPPLVADASETTVTLDLLSDLGLDSLLRGNFDRALERYGEALDLAPQRLDLQLSLADTLHLAGRSDEALALYRELLRKLTSPSTWQERAIQARTLAGLGRNEEALAAARLTEELAGDDPSADFELAVVYARLGFRERALVHVQQALAGGVDRAWLDAPWFEDLRRSGALAEVLGPAAE